MSLRSIDIPSNQRIRGAIDKLGTLARALYEESKLDPELHEMRNEALSADFEKHMNSKVRGN